MGQGIQAYLFNRAKEDFVLFFLVRHSIPAKVIAEE